MIPFSIFRSGIFSFFSPIILPWSSSPTLETKVWLQPYGLVYMRLKYIGKKGLAFDGSIDNHCTSYHLLRVIRVLTLWWWVWANTPLALGGWCMSYGLFGISCLWLREIKIDEELGMCSWWEVIIAAKNRPRLRHWFQGLNKIEMQRKTCSNSL